MPVNLTAKINKTKLNNVLSIVGKDFTIGVKKKVFPRWAQNVDSFMRTAYENHTGAEQGFKTLSKMLSRSTSKTKDGFDLTFFVNPAKKGLGLSTEQVNIWESIAHQTEFGETRDGSKQIRPNKAKILAIPVHPKAKGKSPTEFIGRWINSNAKALFIEDQKRGQKVNRRPGRRRKNAPVSRKARRRTRLTKGPKPKILFVGVKSVNVRRAKPYFGPAVNEVFSGGTNSKAIKKLVKVLSNELNIDESDIRVS